MSLFTVTNQGVITVDTADIKTEFEQAYKEALGANLNTDSSTPVGQLITNDASALTTAMSECVAMANENNVYYATGQALDVAAAMYGYYRKSAVPTTVVALVSGTASTVIPAGTLFSDGTHEYASLNVATIPAGGSISIECQCTEDGAITCPANTLTTIVGTIAGVDSVTNVNDGIVGYDSESDNAFRDRITANFLNKRARAILGAIVDNIAAINNVVSVVGEENPEDDTVTKSGVSMPPHSIFVTVLGGETSAIAEVIAQQKTLGAETVGNTDVSFVDEYSGFVYTYKIYRPSQITLYAKVEYSANEYTASNASDQIKALIVEYITNNPFKVGQTVSGAGLADALNGYNKVDLLAVKVSTDGTNWVDYVTANKTQFVTLSATNISTSEI